MTLEVPDAAKISEWREKCSNGTMTVEEMQEVIRVLRQGRMAAATAPAKASARAKANVNIDSLISDLDAL